MTFTSHLALHSLGPVRVFFSEKENMEIFNFIITRESLRLQHGCKRDWDRYEIIRMCVLRSIRLHRVSSLSCFRFCTQTKLPPRFDRALTMAHPHTSSEPVQSPKFFDHRLKMFNALKSEYDVWVSCMSAFSFLKNAFLYLLHVSATKRTGHHYHARWHGTEG